jgi:hypothetical protein
MAKPALIPSGFSNVKIATLVSDFSRIKVNHQDVSNYRRRNYKFVCLKKRRAITKYFISQGWLVAPKPRLKCFCYHCGKVHVALIPFRKEVHATVENDQVAEFNALATGQSTQRTASAQFQTADNSTASK